MCAQHSCAGGEYRHPDYTGTQIRATNEQKAWMNDWLVGTNMSMMLHRQGLRDALQNIEFVHIVNVGDIRLSKRFPKGAAWCPVQKSIAHRHLYEYKPMHHTTYFFLFHQKQKKTKRQKKHFSQNRPIMISTRVTIVVWLHLVS